MRINVLLAGLLAAGAITAASLNVGWAQSGFWAVDTVACSVDGTRCIKGLVKDGPPFTSRAECEKHAQQLLRQYNAAHLRVTYIRCVPLQ